MLLIVLLVKADLLAWLPRARLLTTGNPLSSLSRWSPSSHYFLEFDNVHLNPFAYLRGKQLILSHVFFYKENS